MNYKMLIEDFPPEVDASLSFWVYDTERSIDGLIQHLAYIRENPEGGEHTITFTYGNVLYSYKLESVKRG